MLRKLVEMLPADFQKTLFDETKANGSEFTIRIIHNNAVLESLTAMKKKTSLTLLMINHDMDLSQISHMTILRNFIMSILKGMAPIALPPRHMRFRKTNFHQPLDFSRNSDALFRKSKL